MSIHRTLGGSQSAKTGRSPYLVYYSVIHASFFWKRQNKKLENYTHITCTLTLRICLLGLFSSSVFYSQTLLVSVSPPCSPHYPHSRSVIAPRIPPSDAECCLGKFQTGLFPHYHGNGKQICWVYFGKALWSDHYFTTPLGTHDGPVWMLLGKSLVELTHHISQAFKRTRCSSQGPVFQSSSPLPSVSELLGWMFLDTMASFDWTGTAWKKSSPKCFSQG